MEEALVSSGLSKNEAKIFLALVESGEATISELSKKTPIHRANIYDTIKSLMNKGLVSYIESKGTNVYQITNFSNLLNIIKEKEQKIVDILPQLELLRNLSSSRSEARILEGLPAAKRVMENFLLHNEPILVMGVPSNVGHLIGPFLQRFHRKRIKNGIVMKHIYNTDAHERIQVLKKMKHTQVRLLPSEFNSPVATNIVGDEVNLIYWSKQAIIIQIKNKLIADAYKKYFGLLWKQAKPL